MPYKRFANIVFGFKILFITLEASAINTTLSIQGETQPVKPGKRHERSLENDRPCSGKNMEFDSPNGSLASTMIYATKFLKIVVRTSLRNAAIRHRLWTRG
jgi:hypothetical protein